MDKVSVSDSVIEEWLKVIPARGEEAFDYPIRGDFSYLRGFCEGIGIHVDRKLWEWEDEYEGFLF